jgi:hypothetical protein
MIPPFYSGQKIVCINDSWQAPKKIKNWLGISRTEMRPTSGPCKDSVQEVFDCYRYEDKWYVRLYNYTLNQGFVSEAFRPLEKLPLLKLSQIRKREQVEILSDN